MLNVDDQAEHEPMDQPPIPVDHIATFKRDLLIGMAVGAIIGFLGEIALGTVVGSIFPLVALRSLIADMLKTLRQHREALPKTLKFGLMSNVVLMPLSASGLVFVGALIGFALKLVQAR